MGYVTLRIKAEEAQAIQSFQKLTDAEKKVELQSKKVAVQSKRTTGIASKGALQAFAAVKSWATGLVSVGAAVGLVTRALRDMNAERRRGAAGITEGTLPRAALAQLARTPKQRLAMEAEVERSRLGGVPRDLAYGLQFQLESLGMARHRKLFASLYPTVAEPGEIAAGVDTIRAALGPREVGSVRAATNKLFAASQISRARAEEFAPAMATAAGAAGLARISDEELFAAIARTTRPAGGAAVAATRVRAFLSATTKKGGFEGLGIVGRARRLAGMGMNAQQLTEFLGRKEAVAGLSDILKMAPDIRATTAEMYRVGAATGTEADYLRGMGVAGVAMPSSRAARIERVERETGALVRERRLGPEQLLREAVAARVRSSARARGESEATVWMLGMGADVEAFFGSSPEKMARVGHLPPAEFAELKAAMGDLTRSIDYKGRLTRGGPE